MLSLLSKVFGGIWAYVIGIGAALLGLGAALLMARRSGVKAEQAVETEMALKQAEESNEIDSKVRALPQSELDAKLKKDQRD